VEGEEINNQVTKQPRRRRDRLQKDSYGAAVETCGLWGHSGKSRQIKVGGGDFQIFRFEDYQVAEMSKVQ
jgi:hypothetical protein